MLYERYILEVLWKDALVEGAGEVLLGRFDSKHSIGDGAALHFVKSDCFGDVYRGTGKKSERLWKAYNVLEYESKQKSAG